MCFPLPSKVELETRRFIHWLLLEAVQQCVSALVSI